jgi:hypothetical protein
MPLCERLATFAGTEYASVLLWIVRSLRSEHLWTK